MKTLNLATLDFGKEVEQEWKKAGLNYSPTEVFKNVFKIAANKTFERGATLEQQRLYSNIVNNIKPEMEFSDDEYKFLTQAFKESQLPLSYSEVLLKIDSIL